MEPFPLKNPQAAASCNATGVFRKGWAPSPQSCRPWGRI